MNLKRLAELIEMSEERVFRHLLRILPQMGYQVIRGRMDYIIAVPPKPSPWCLVAHLDTIPRMQGVELEYQGVWISNKRGVLGADDRAGVYAILELAQSAKSLPYLIFTTGEERGGIGVNALIRDKAFDPFIDDVALFIEIDRQGADEYVYYSWELPAEVHAIAKNYGFVEGMGSYSDVRDLTDHYGVPHLNLSAGYYNQHSKREVLDWTALEMTINRVTRMMADVEPPRVFVQPDQWWLDQELAEEEGVAVEYEVDEFGFEVPVEDEARLNGLSDEEFLRQVEYWRERAAVENQK